MYDSVVSTGDLPIAAASRSARICALSRAFSLPWLLLCRSLESVKDASEPAGFAPSAPVVARS